MNLLRGISANNYFRRFLNMNKLQNRIASRIRGCQNNRSGVGMISLSGFPAIISETNIVYKPIRKVFARSLSCKERSSDDFGQ